MTNDTNNGQRKHPDIKKTPSTDGTIDEDYAWGRPVTTYLSPHQHLRILLVRARLEATGARSELRARGR